MKVKTIVQILLVAAALVLVYFIYTSLVTPINFEKDFKYRSEQTIVKLKEIRTLEEAYKYSNGRYCSDVDSLLAFLRTGKVTFVKLQKLADYPDTMSDAEAIKRGFIKRDTSYMNPLEKLREDKKIFMNDEQLDDLKYIPFSEGEKFVMKVGTVDRNGLELPVFEVKAPFTAFLKGLDEQMVDNKIAELDSQKKGDGWKVGSLDEPITEGNFE